MVLVFILGLMVVVVVLGFLMYFRKNVSDLDDPLNPAQIAKRKQSLDKILVLSAQRVQITNIDVQKFLGISEATSSRYLEYLVALGKLSRINDRGQEVRYQIIK